MWTIAQLEEKIAQVATQLKQTEANFNVLLGSKTTYESLLADVKKAADVGEKVIEAVAGEQVVPAASQ